MSDLLYWLSSVWINNWFGVHNVNFYIEKEQDNWDKEWSLKTRNTQLSLQKEKWGKKEKREWYIHLLSW